MPPPYFFTSPAIYRQEVSTVFFKEWICVGRTEQLSEPSDFLTLELAGEPVVITRDENGDLHALSAICRHKSAIVASGSGNCRVFSCPYHGWTYSLDGKLLAARGMDSTINFDKDTWSLPSFQLEVWAGFIFINFDPNCEPLGPRLVELTVRLKNYGVHDMQVAQSEDYPIECNWKVWVDNGTEAYHVDMVHQESALPDYPSAIWRAEAPHGHYEILKVTPTVATTETATGAAPVPMIDGLTKEERDQFLIVFIYPNLIINLMSMAMIFGVVMPQGPTRCRLMGGRCFPPATMRSPQFASGSETLYANWEKLRREDITMVAPAQRGYHSTMAGRGRYSEQEPLPHRLHNYVIDRIL